jgi:DNA polymerase I-like protein with 3'-5' exonuclease and polymerase domains
LLSQVCDELISEVPEKGLIEAKRLVKHVMKEVGPQRGLSAPLKKELARKKLASGPFNNTE